MSSTAENPWQQFSTPESVVQELVAAPEESPEQMIAPSSTNWLAASLIEAVEWSQKAERDLDLGKFAQDLSISVRQVKRAYQSLSETLTSEPEDEEPDQA